MKLIDKISDGKVVISFFVGIGFGFFAYLVWLGILSNNADFPNGKVPIICFAIMFSLVSIGGIIMAFYFYKKSNSYLGRLKPEDKEKNINKKKIDFEQLSKLIFSVFFILLGIAFLSVTIKNKEFILSLLPALFIVGGIIFFIWFIKSRKGIS